MAPGELTLFLLGKWDGTKLRWTLFIAWKFFLSSKRLKVSKCCPSVNLKGASPCAATSQGACKNPLCKRSPQLVLFPPSPGMKGKVISGEGLPPVVYFRKISPRTGGTPPVFCVAGKKKVRLGGRGSLGVIISRPLSSSPRQRLSDQSLPFRQTGVGPCPSASG